MSMPRLARPGYKFGAPGGTEKDDQFVRSAMYGSFSRAAWPGTSTAPKGSGARTSRPRRRSRCGTPSSGISGEQMQHLRTFALSIGKRYQELVPDADLVSPNKTHGCGRTKAGPTAPGRRTRRSSCVFREGLSAQPGPRRQAQQHLPGGVVRSAKRHLATRATVACLQLTGLGIINLPDFPGDNDWGLRLTYAGPIAAAERRIPGLILRASP